MKGRQGAAAPRRDVRPAVAAARAVHQQEAGVTRCHAHFHRRPQVLAQCPHRVQAGSRCVLDTGRAREARRAAAACGAAARARTTVSADTGPSAPTRVLAADACMRSSAIGREDACAWRRWRRPQLASGRRRLLERRGPRYRCVRPCSHPCWAQAAFICHPHLLLPASARAPLVRALSSARSTVSRPWRPVSARGAILFAAEAAPCWCGQDACL